MTVENVEMDTSEPKDNIIRFEGTQDPLKTTTVSKLIELDIDVGTLLASDTNELDLKELRGNTDDYLKNLARDNTQLLFNAVWQIPTERYEDCIVAKLPQPTYVLPREKPLPKPKPLTKWEEFAKKKGISPKKKSNVTWDEVLKKWVPRYGYKKSAAEKEKDWIIEVPQSVDPYTDMFEKKAEIKAEKINKNEYQRLRNIAKGKKIKVPSMGLPPTGKLNSLQLNSAANIAHVSTASLGKFQPHSSKEKLLNKASILQRKKKGLPPPKSHEEHERNMKIVNTILNKKPRVDLDKAVNKHIHSEEVEASDRKNNKRKGRGGQKKKGGRGGPRNAKDGKKPKGGGGKRIFAGKNKPSGRKRR
uniref:Ribosome biogenesis regulatory protein n=2 Tax=Lygus hesperus TaxID=30085 RepID=A0A0A9W6R7_LYGHE